MATECFIVSEQCECKGDEANIHGSLNHIIIIIKVFVRI